MLWLALCAAASAQPASIFLQASDARMICGDRMAVSVLVQDRSGNALSNLAVNWTSSDPTVATVDSRGSVAALKPGFVSIAAASGNVRSTIQLQTVPLRMEVSPPDAELIVGDQLQFSARALDRNEQPVDGVRFVWQTAGATGNNTAAAIIDATGMLSAIGVNTVTVRAMIQYTGVPTGPYVQQFLGLTTARIRPRTDYRVRKLLGSDESRSWFRLLARGGGLAMNDSGKLAFTGALDGLADGVLLAGGGRLQMLFAGGTPTFNPGGIVIDFDDPAINSAGTVAVHANTWNSAGGVLLLGAGDPQYAVVDGTSPPGYNDVTNTRSNRFSLNDDGVLAFSANYIPTGASARANGIFSVSGGRISLNVSTSESTLPGLTGTFTLDNDFGIDKQGIVYFGASDNSRHIVYRRNLDGSFTKALGTGDSLAGSTVRGIQRANRLCPTLW